MGLVERLGQDAHVGEVSSRTPSQLRGRAIGLDPCHRGQDAREPTYEIPCPAPDIQGLRPTSRTDPTRMVEYKRGIGIVVRPRMRVVEPTHCGQRSLEGGSHAATIPTDPQHQVGQ
ncbi:hypothetical protein GCM10027269_28740 [Kribbella endophytica]